jgi:bifunctional DNA-binding transcriptional regulator/antitoxin component of YhaV-PrlF toxin-antitoxin module
MGMATVSVRRDGQVTLPEEIRSAYHLTEGAVLDIVPITDDRFEMRVIAKRLHLLDLLDEFADEGVAPDLAAEREAMGDALDAALLNGGQRP